MYLPSVFGSCYKRCLASPYFCLFALSQFMQPFAKTFWMFQNSHKEKQLVKQLLNLSQVFLLEMNEKE